MTNLIYVVVRILAFCGHISVWNVFKIWGKYLKLTNNGDYKYIDLLPTLNTYYLDIYEYISRVDLIFIFRIGCEIFFAQGNERGTNTYWSMTFWNLMFCHLFFCLRTWQKSQKKYNNIKFLPSFHALSIFKK